MHFAHTLFSSQIKNQLNKIKEKKMNNKKLFPFLILILFFISFVFPQPADKTIKTKNIKNISTKDVTNFYKNNPEEIVQLLSAKDSSWSKSYGGTNLDYGECVISTSDGGLLIAGCTQSFGVGSYDFLVIKLNMDGGISWAKTYGGGNSDFAWTALQTSDGGYLIGGETSSYGAGNNDFFIIKIDSEGNPSWAKAYGGDQIDFIYSMAETSDGKFVAVGNTNSFGSGGFDFMIMKFDSSGNVSWCETFGDAQDDDANYVISTSSGGCLVAGRTVSSAGNSAFLLISLDSDGATLWEKAYAVGSVDKAYSICKTSDGYLVLGSTNSGSDDNFLIIKINSSGDVSWAETIGDSGDDEPYSVVETSDNGFIVTGSTDSYGSGGKDFFIVKLDSTGSITWAKTFGGNNDDEAKSVIQTSGGEYVITGSTESFGTNKEVLTIMLNTSGTIPDCNHLASCTPSKNSVTVNSITSTFLATAVIITTTSVTTSTSTPSLTMNTPCCGDNGATLDVNGDGKVDAVDLCETLNAIVGNIPSDSRYDINCDGNVDSTDSEIIASSLAGNN